MLLCGECNTETEDGSHHCPNCGGASWVEFSATPTKATRRTRGGPVDTTGEAETKTPPAPPASEG